MEHLNYSTHLDSNLSLKYSTVLEVSDSDEHASLIKSSIDFAAVKSFIVYTLVNEGYLSQTRVIYIRVKLMVSFEFLELWEKRFDDKNQKRCIISGLTGVADAPRNGRRDVLASWRKGELTKWLLEKLWFDEMSRWKERWNSMLIK